MALEENHFWQIHSKISLCASQGAHTVKHSCPPFGHPNLWTQWWALERIFMWLWEDANCDRPTKGSTQRQKGIPSLLHFSTHCVGSIAMSIVRVEMQDPNRIFSRWEDKKWAVSVGSSRETWIGSGREPVAHGLWYEPVRVLQHWAEWSRPGPSACSATG